LTLQDHPRLPCGGAKDCEEGSEDPKDQGEANIEMKWPKLSIPLKVFGGWVNPKACSVLC
jgi:hypothetical protein